MEIIKSRTQEDKLKHFLLREKIIPKKYEKKCNTLFNKIDEIQEKIYRKGDILEAILKVHKYKDKLNIPQKKYEEIISVRNREVRNLESLVRQKDRLLKEIRHSCI